MSSKYKEDGQIKWERLVGQCSMHAEMRYCNKISVITSEEKNLEDMVVDGWEFLL
jgi:hypothetical protein